MAFDWNNILAATGGGAMTGGSVGMAGGPLGAGIGAGVGGALGLAATLGPELYNYLFGSGQQSGGQQPNTMHEGVNQVPTMSPEQIQAILAQLTSGQQTMANPYEGFQPIENLARQNFNQQSIPSLADRFSSLGSGNALSSTSYQNAKAAAQAGLETELAAMRAKYGMQNKEFGLQQLKAGLNPMFETVNQPRKPGFGENLFTSGIQALPGAANMYSQYEMRNKLQQLLDAQQNKGTSQSQKFWEDFNSIRGTGLSAPQPFRIA